MAGRRQMHPDAVTPHTCCKGNAKNLIAKNYSGIIRKTRPCRTACKGALRL